MYTKPSFELKPISKSELEVMPESALMKAQRDGNDWYQAERERLGSMMLRVAEKAIRRAGVSVTDLLDPYFDYAHTLYSSVIEVSQLAYSRPIVVEIDRRYAAQNEQAREAETAAERRLAERIERERVPDKWKKIGDDLWVRGDWRIVRLPAFSGGFVYVAETIENGYPVKSTVYRKLGDAQAWVSDYAGWDKGQVQEKGAESDASTFESQLLDMPVRSNVDIGKKERGARVVSVTRTPTGYQVIYGDWKTNSYQPGALSFDVSPVQPTSREYKTAGGAAKAVRAWLERDEPFAGGPAVPVVVAAPAVAEIEQYVPFDRFEGDGYLQPYKIDGSKVRFWAKKPDAEAAAVALGWRKSDVIKVQTRFQIGWAIGDGRLGLLSKPWIEARLAEKSKTPVESAKSDAGLKVGDILYTSWGYDQTNVDFYQVVRVKNKTVDIRRISSTIVRSERGADYVAPNVGDFIGDVIPNKRPSAGGYVKISTSRSASPWNGKPMYQTPVNMRH